MKGSYKLRLESSCGPLLVCCGGPRLRVAVGAASVVRCSWLLAFLRFCFIKNGQATQEATNFSTRSEDPADWHRPENQNFFRYLQRQQRTSTAKCLLRVSSWYGSWYCGFWYVFSWKPALLYSFWSTAVDVEESHFIGCRGRSVSFNFVHVLEETLLPAVAAQANSGQLILFGTCLADQSSFQSSSGAQALARGRATDLHCCGSHSRYRLQDRRVAWSSFLPLVKWP